VIDMLAAVLLVTLVLALLAGLGVALAVAPFVLGVDMAERRRFSTDRWGAVCLLGIAVALVWVFQVHHGDWPRPLHLLALVPAWAGPAVLAVLGPGQRAGGTQGAHEH
jgi:bacteriorhodopsin